MVINSLVFKLKKQLATKVKGKVYVSYDKNSIYVEVENSAKYIWCTNIPFLQAKVYEQKMVTIRTRVVITQYKEDILDKYFLKENLQIQLTKTRLSDIINNVRRTYLLNTKG